MKKANQLRKNMCCKSVLVYFCIKRTTFYDKLCFEKGYSLTKIYHILCTFNVYIGSLLK